MTDKLTTTLTTSDGLNLHYVCWVPKGSIASGSKPKAVVLVVHGMAEHSGRFEDVAEVFCEQNIAVASFDQRGHGQSDGPRGHTPTYDLLLESVQMAIQQARKRFPDLPLFLYGHSMGGNLALNYVLKQASTDATIHDNTSANSNTNITPTGLIISAPWLRLAFQPPALQIALAKIAVKFAPGFTQTAKLDSTAISSDPEQVKRYQEDPLIHDKITASMFFSVHERGEWALQNASKLKIPTLLFHGTGDRLTSHKASAEFAQKAGSIAEFHAIEDGFHELHHEAESLRMKWQGLVTGWITQHLR